MHNIYKTECPVALKLHLELNLENIDDEEMNLLKKYGKVNSGITRDIIVPSNITLHALHYAIQKLFGWQSSHLHHYELPEDVFKDLTHNKTKQWLRLCGVYFRFPDTNNEDRYWDDDYDESFSFDTWLKEKYTGPYQYWGVGDYYFTNQMLVENVKEEMPRFQVGESFDEYMERKRNPKAKKKMPKVVSLENATMEEFLNSMTFDTPINSLLERQAIMDYMLLPNNRSLCFHGNLEEKLSLLEDGLKDNIEKWDNIILNLLNKTKDFSDMIRFSTIKNQSVTDTLKYRYDYGDDWAVAVTCTDAYYENENQANFTDAYEKIVDNDISQHIDSVISKHSPICIAADGLNVFDDVGGVHGFCEFLKNIHKRNNDEEKYETIEWARSMGWTGRASKPNNKL